MSPSISPVHPRVPGRRRRRTGELIEKEHHTLLNTRISQQVLRRSPGGARVNHSDDQMGGGVHGLRL